MSLKSGNSSARKSAASRSTRSAEFAPLPQHEADEDNTMSGDLEGTSRSRKPSIELQRKEGEHLNGQDDSGGHVIQGVQTNSYGGWVQGQGGSPLPSESSTREKSSLKSQRSFMSRILVDSWIWEALCWVLSVACLIAIVIILHTYDGQPIPQWRSGITLNAMVSVFTSIAKAALLFPVAESISQLKWVWFSMKSRELQDFATFDNASKGIWGSVLLLCTPKAKHWVSLGAIAMIFGTAVEPFTQQIISFPQRLDPSQASSVKASVAYSHNFTNSRDTSEDNILVTDVDIPMMLSIYSGAFHPANVSIEPMAPNCTTGNCTFPDFFSIAVCARGTDITHLLGQGCNATRLPGNTSCNRTLPNDMYLENYSLTNISTTTAMVNYRSLAFPDNTHPLANVFIIYSDLGVLGPTRATEFIFEFCVKRYRTAVSNGRAHTEELVTYTNYTLDSYIISAPNNELGMPVLQLIDLVFSVPGSPVNYTVPHVVRRSTGNFFKKLFRSTTEGTDTNWAMLDTAFINAIMAPPFNQAAIQGLMDNVAMSVTNDARGRNANDKGAPLQGTAFSVVPFVHVQWEWITMLVVLVVLTLVLLVGTVLQTLHTRTKLWKSNSLAVLRAGAGADEALRRDWAAGGMERMGVVEKQGKAVEIKLVNEKGVGGGGWRLVRG